MAEGRQTDQHTYMLNSGDYCRGTKLALLALQEHGPSLCEGTGRFSYWEVLCVVPTETTLLLLRMEI